MAKTVLEITNATLGFGSKKLWKNLNLQVGAGELVAALGPNGAGKSTLIKSILGLQKLDSGSIAIASQPSRKMLGAIGYIPQQKSFDSSTPMRSQDLVQLGASGNHWWFGGNSKKENAQINAALAEVGMGKYANKPIGKLSGGQQQRVRIAQALVGSPQVLLCDEPLLSLDVGSQQTIVNLIAEQRKKGAAVLFVTHEINPILPIVDKILYLVGGKWVLGTPKEILTKETLSKLYGTCVDVLNLHGQIIVYCAEKDHVMAEPHGAQHHAHMQGENNE